MAAAKDRAPAPSEDERYTIEYIEREALLILDFLNLKNRKRPLKTMLTANDHRILRNVIRG